MCFCLVVVVVGFFVCMIFWGFVVGLFFVLGCGLGFDWLLLWCGIFFHHDCGMSPIWFIKILVLFSMLFCFAFAESKFSC